MLELEDIFGHGGPLERALPDFKVRREQLRMAERVGGALTRASCWWWRRAPAPARPSPTWYRALLSGARVLISTGTRTLQDQLFTKDLPLVAAAIGRPARVALLKGRANYLCRYRLAACRAGRRAADAHGDAKRRAAAPHAACWRASSAGHARPRGAIWPRCVACPTAPGLARRSPRRARTASARAARRSRAVTWRSPAARHSNADIVIVNHHLLLADLALKEDGFGDMLGSADAVILDEAHQIPDLATQFFGANVSSRQVETLVRDLRLELHAPAAGGAAAEPALRAVEDGPAGPACRAARHSGTQRLGRRRRLQRGGRAGADRGARAAGGSVRCGGLGRCAATRRARRGAGGEPRAHRRRRRARGCAHARGHARAASP